MKTRQGAAIFSIAVMLLAPAILLPQPALAAEITFSFSDKDFLGGASWGTLTLTSFGANYLYVRYDASPSSIIPAGSEVTGFGLTFIPNTILPKTENPSDQFFTDDQDNLNWTTLTNLNAIPDPSNGDEFTPPVTKADFYFGVTEGNAGNLTPPGIEPGQSDVYILDFRDTLPVPDDLSKFIALTGIRIQSLPYEINEGSLFLVGGPPDIPVPEPGTMLLLGSGLVGVATWGRKKSRR